MVGVGEEVASVIEQEEKRRRSQDWEMDALLLKKMRGREVTKDVGVCLTLRILTLTQVEDRTPAALIRPRNTLEVRKRDNSFMNPVEGRYTGYDMWAFLRYTSEGVADIPNIKRCRRSRSLRTGSLASGKKHDHVALTTDSTTSGQVHLSCLVLSNGRTMCRSECLVRGAKYGSMLQVSPLNAQLALNHPRFISQ